MVVDERTRMIWSDNILLYIAMMPVMLASDDGISKEEIQATAAKHCWKDKFLQQDRKKRTRLQH